LLTDPLFYLVSIPAVVLYGISKGGFGGGFAMMAVPLMALLMHPLQAAAILLPILVLMDVIVVKTYWGQFDKRTLQLLLPGALVGVVIGYLTAGAMNEHYLRVMVGSISVLFGLQYLLGIGSKAGATHSIPSATFFGTLSGFTSFSIHAGGPPLAMYLIPKGLTPVLFAGTSAVFFFVVNAAKLIPYYQLGQFTTDNLLYSLVLIPFAPVGVAIGHFLVKRSGSSFYYKFISFFLLVVGLKLLWDGVAGL